MNRREFLALLAAGAAGACTNGGGRERAAPSTTRASTTSTTVTRPGVTAGVPEPGTPFTLGVASGDPVADGVVLWTRLAPSPLDGGGMPDAAVEVEWEVAEDEGFRRVAARGSVDATPAQAHSVHADVTGLQAGTDYWYRFRAGEHLSPAGRSRTAPGAGAKVAGARFAFASCQDWQDGYYGAHAHLAAEDLDFVVWLGDYIYEAGPSDTALRRHEGAEARDLAAYRNRYAQYKTDAALQAAHAAAPWIVTWDDHEVSNDYAGDAPSSGGDPSVFRARRAAAYQAWYEHQPVRLAPSGADYPIHRSLPFGDLLALFVVDGRQYRSPGACGGGSGAVCPEVDDPTRTFLGADQEAWLVDGLTTAPQRWKVIANDVIMTDCAVEFGGTAIVNFDQWDGYRAARDRLLGALRDARVSDTVVITGDIHAALIGDLAAGEDVVGTEFVGPSISSLFPADYMTAFGALPALARRVRFADAQHHGYVVLDVTPEACRADYRAVASVAEPSSTITTASSWTVEDGRPGAAPT